MHLLCATLITSRPLRPYDEVINGKGGATGEVPDSRPSTLAETD